MIILQVGALILGSTLIVITLLSAVRALVLPRSAPDLIFIGVFRGIRWGFDLLISRTKDYAKRDRLMAYFAPISLIMLVPVWMVLLTLGYTGVFWVLDNVPVYQAFRISVSSLLTLGYASHESVISTVLEFSAATAGLMLIALLIAYLPSMYSAFSRREAAVKLLEVRAGNPPSAEEMIARYHRIHGLEQLGDQWTSWELWFTELEESHTALSALVFFRSPQTGHSWVTTAITILDAAAFTLAAIETPFDARAALCIRAGYLALRGIGDSFRLPYPIDPHYPDDPISVSWEEFDSALDTLERIGVPLKDNRRQAYQDFAGWRVNYDRFIPELVELTMAPAAPWTGERPYH